MKLKDLLEDISIDGDQLRIAVQHYKSGSTKKSISTSFRSQPYITAVKGCDAEIYSLLNYVSSEDSTKILQALKGSGSLKVDDRQFQHFMEEVRIAAEKIVKRISPDVIIFPKSSSNFLKQFIEKVIKSAPSAEILPDSFVKSMLDAEDVEPLINTEHPDWEKFAETHPKEVVKLKKALKVQIKNGELELKKFYKPYLKFVKNFIELRNAYDVLDKVLDKKVLVVDDILSSGATMYEMCRQLKELEPSKIVGLTVFKHTTTPKQP